MQITFHWGKTLWIRCLYQDEVSCSSGRSPSSLLQPPIDHRHCFHCIMQNMCQYKLAKLKRPNNSAFKAFFFSLKIRLNKLPTFMQSSFNIYQTLTDLDHIIKKVFA